MISNEHRSNKRPSIMLRSTTFWNAAFLCLLAHAGAAHAQTAASSSPSSAPPKLERIEEGSDAPITVTAKPKAEKKITEKKEQGRVTEVEVQSGKSHYVMKPNVPAGNAQPGDAQSGAIRAPQWKVMEFDLGKKKKKEVEEEAAASTPPPPASTPSK
jgi:hypothetical protein